MKKNKLLLATGILLISIIMSACTLDDSTSIEAGQQEVMSKNAIKQTGLPNITNFTEKKLMKHLYEIRDEKIKTFTYYTDMGGNKHLLCKSIGFGLPYSTQYSNPEKVDSYAQSITLPQAEPNGLYMPSSAEATWVQCVSPKGTIEPVYSEERLTISTFKLGKN